MFFPLTQFGGGAEFLAVTRGTGSDQDCANSNVNGDVWTRNVGVLGNSSGYTQIAYSPKYDRFVAISNEVWAYTDDIGDAWGSISASDDSARAICWSKTREEFFLITPGGVGADLAYKSPSGLVGTWVSAGEPITIMPQGVPRILYLDDPFFQYITLGGNDVKSFISTTGESTDWTAYTMLGGVNKGISWFDYSPAQHRLCAVPEGVGFTFFNESYYSDDGGENWNVAPLDVGNNHRWSSVMWCKEIGLWVATAGFAGGSGASEQDNVIAWSTNAESWTIGTIPGDPQTWGPMSYNGQNLVIMNNDAVGATEIVYGPHPNSLTRVVGGQGGGNWSSIDCRRDDTL